MPDNTINIRTATAADAEALVPLINRAFAMELKYFSTERIDMPGVLAHMEKGTVLVAEEAGKLAGCVYLELRGDLSYFGLLAVDPEAQGRGIGLNLIDAAEDLGRDAGCTVMQIRILHLRTELPPFYEKLGYAVARYETPPQIPSAYQPYQFILMEKGL
jgi:N-acetylglutamate synthase-like GNAT family acetyltransferase